MSKKVKIAYALRPVVIQDESGKEIIVYEKFHPITTGNAVVVNGATLTNIVKDLYTKAEVDEMVANAIKVKSVNGMTGAVLITAEAIGALTYKDITNKVDKIPGLTLVPETKVIAYDSHLTNKNNPHGVTKSQVGLGNVDNTSDANKPVSTAQQTALNKKVDKVDGSSLVADTKVSGYDAHLANKSNPHNVTKEQVGLGSVTNDAQVKRSEMGVANGVATLNSNGVIPSSQLPSYVDDVMEFDGTINFPSTGETGKVYIDISTNISYRWGGSTYVPIGSDLALGETSSTAYAGDKGKANAEAITSLNGKVEQLTNRFDALGLYVDADGDICQRD